MACRCSVIRPRRCSTPASSSSPCFRTSGRRGSTSSLIPLSHSPRCWSSCAPGASAGPARASAALSYTFGAPILFQYCNIIYLVGAAWLPLGIHAVDRWVRLGRRWAILELAVVLGMQVLGGDPQSAFLLGIAGLGYALALANARDARSPTALRSGQQERHQTASRRVLRSWWPRQSRCSPAWFAATVILGIVLPEIQASPRWPADTRPCPGSAR